MPLSLAAPPRHLEFPRPAPFHYHRSDEVRTSSLFHYLAQHPQILPAFQRKFHKEVHYFDHNFARGERWYRAHFPLETEVRADSITGEASPLYLFHPLVAERIGELVPKVKLLAILRNPTERAISHYFHEVRKNREHLPIMEAFRAEDSRINGALQSGDFDNRAYLYSSYKRRGIYREQIERYWRRFSGDQMLVLNSEAFFKAPRDTLKKVFRFLEIDEGFEVDKLEPRNVGENRTDVDREAYDYLDEFFFPHNQMLYRQLGQDFGW